MHFENYLSPFAIIIFFSLENIFPYFKKRKFKVQLNHSLINIYFGIINGILVYFFYSFILIKLFILIDNRSIGLLFLIFNIGYSYKKIILGFILFDLWMYFWHILNHKIKIFWLFHRTHHSDTKLDASTSLRFHLGEIFFSEIFRIPIYLFFGLNFNILIIYKISLNIITLFHHSNIGINEKIDNLLKLLIVTPNMHRVHHSLIKNETNSNYSTVFSFWDRIFGSYKKIIDTTKIILGLEYFRENKWQKFSGILIMPFIKFK